MRLLSKKFDICLMNPPYDKNLHLKFLEKAIDITNKVVSVQPAEFILRTNIKPTYATLKETYKQSIGKHIVSLDPIKHPEKLFDAGIDTSLSIYVCDDKGGFDYDNYYKTYNKKQLSLEEQFKTKYTIKDKLEKYTNQKYFVPIRLDGIIDRWWTLQLINYLDIIVEGKIYSGDYKGLSIIEARQHNPHENHRNDDRDTYGVSFDTLNEAINFRDSLKLEAYLYIIAVLKTTRNNPLSKLPLLDSYKEKMNNEYIFDYFNIDKKYREDIIQTLEPFTHKTKNVNGLLNKVKEHFDTYE